MFYKVQISNARRQLRNAQLDLKQADTAADKVLCQRAIEDAKAQLTRAESAYQASRECRDDAIESEQSPDTQGD